MIISTKNAICGFDANDALYISETDDHQFMVSVYFNAKTEAVHGIEVSLGKYKTREKASEVLQKISNAFINGDNSVSLDDEKEEMVTIPVNEYDELLLEAQATEGVRAAGIEPNYILDVVNALEGKSLLLVSK